MDGHFLTKSHQRVCSLQPLELYRRVLVQELVDREEASTNLDFDLSSRHFDEDFASAKLVDTLGLSHEHNLELLSFRIVVDVLGKFHVNLVSLHRNVDCDTVLDGKNILLECLHIDPVPLLLITQLLEQFKGKLVGIEALLLEG